MTELLEKAVATARTLSPEMQDEIARVMLALAHDERNVHQFTAEEAAEQDAADAEEARGDYATEEEVRALWAKVLASKNREASAEPQTDRAEFLRRLEEISARAGKLTVLDTRSADEILGYDENGVPS